MKPAVQQTLTDALRNAEIADAQGIAIVMLGAEPGMIMSVVAADVPEQGCRNLARALRRLADEITPYADLHGITR